MGREVVHTQKVVCYTSVIGRLNSTGQLKSVRHSSACSGMARPRDSHTLFRTACNTLRVQTRRVCFIGREFNVHCVLSVLNKVPLLHWRKLGTRHTDIRSCRLLVRRSLVKSIALTAADD